ncbi:uncharacterized protein LOC121837293 [Ixodes scapularis]|uniref:uncharacterized protein LOC121837293 n=1 Tax=Ixodes scapularis TaxID=6945 RepID=UPI001C3904D6|nr:uncharacterized protein LOC121837293 [Ixodes scapularis]
MKSVGGSHPARGPSSGDRNGGSSVTSKIKLPKLKLIQFNGHLKDWQPFWQQFDTAIHQNPELTPSEKFNYLRSALTGDGAAAIGGLQPTAECYADAIELLQQRFGKQETLIQDHMEGLMDIQPVPPQRNTRALRRLYDTLQAHIRGLRALGVGEEAYGAMLYTVLLRVLPRDITLDFNRKMSAEETGNANAARASMTDASLESAPQQVHLRALRFLLDFLRIEVESRERTSKHQLEDAVGKPRPSSLTHGSVKRSTINAQTRSSTAAALHGSVDVLECFLCKSKAHGTPECNARIGLAEKKRRLQADRRCFRCTKANHMARLCRGAPSCGKCQGRHASTMCDPNYAPGKTSTRSNETEPKEPAPVAMHVRGRNSKPAVLLQTVTAWAEGTNRRKLARIIFDSGSQRSFITEELSQRLDCKLLGTEILTIGVFGGESTEHTFRRVQVTLRDQHYNKEYDIDALETPTICEQDLPSPDEAIVATLEELGCPVGDNMTGLEQRGVDILLGSDHYWGCITGRIHRLSGRLTAVETVFGWAVQGRTMSTSAVISCSQVVVLRTAVQEPQTLPSFKQSWELENMGVIDASVEDPSDNDVSRDSETKIAKTKRTYEVGLPWKVDFRLADNKVPRMLKKNCESATWNHLPGKKNPVGLLSRGLTASGLVSAPLCCAGTSWLPLPAEERPKEKREEPRRDKLEERGSRAEVFEVTLCFKDQQNNGLDFSISPQRQVN